MTDVYIVDYLRIPFGRFGKSLKDVSPVDMSSFLIKEILKRNNLSPDNIEFVVMGHVIRAGTGMNTARHAAIKAGIPYHTDAMNVDMVCASGMTAIITGSQYIKAGSYDLVVAGGMESMSKSPFLIDSRIRWGIKHLVGNEMKIEDSMVHDGLFDPIHNVLMGEIADRIAQKYGAPREELDEIALESHMRANKAWENGLFKDHVLPFPLNKEFSLEKDEGIRPNLNMEKIKNLSYIFTKEGPHTAASSSQLSDGAAIVLIASSKALKKFGLEPKAKVIAHEYVGVPPTEYPLAPIKAVKKILEKSGWSIDKVDFWENNEAFAINSYLMHKLLGIDYEILNVHGGAIAVGHPLGASGARIVGEILNVLEKHGGSRGIASICHGLGGAAAMAVELL